MLSVEIASNDSNVLEIFALKENDEPMLLIADMRSDTMRKYIFEGSLKDSGTIAGFINDFFAGKVKVRCEENDRMAGKIGVSQIVACSSIKLLNTLGCEGFGKDRQLGSG